MQNRVARLFRLPAHVRTLLYEKLQNVRVGASDDEPQSCLVVFLVIDVHAGGENEIDASLQLRVCLASFLGPRNQQPPQRVGAGTWPGLEQMIRRLTIGHTAERWRTFTVDRFDVCTVVEQQVRGRDAHWLEHRAAACNV